MSGGITAWIRCLMCMRCVLLAVYLVGDELSVNRSSVCWKLAADEAGVEGAGEADVRGALDESSAVGKDREGVRGVGEAQEEAVGADGAQGFEAGLQLGEVEGEVVLVDLNGVAAAEGDVGALVSGERSEDALVTDFAADAGG